MKLTVDDLIAPPSPEIDLSEVFASLKEVDPAAVTRAFRYVPYPIFLETTYWRSVSVGVKKRDGHRCKVCNRSNHLQAHHRNYEMPRGSEHLNLNDLTTLCDQCHSLFHKNRIPIKKTKSTKINLKTQLDRMPVANSAVAEEGKIILTRENINACQINGCFTAVAMKALSPHDLKKGWTSRLIGTSISKADYQRAVEGRCMTRKALKERRDGNFFVRRNGSVVYAPL